MGGKEWGGRVFSLTITRVPNVLNLKLLRKCIPRKPRPMIICIVKPNLHLRRISVAHATRQEEHEGEGEDLVLEAELAGEGGGGVDAVVAVEGGVPEFGEGGGDR